MGDSEGRSSSRLKLMTVTFYLHCPRRASGRATVVKVVGVELLPLRSRANADEPIKTGPDVRVRKLGATQSARDKMIQSPYALQDSATCTQANFLSISQLGRGSS